MSGPENSMSEARPAASLTANLLARRGAARPAMRRPSLASLQSGHGFGDDLGWNDMGEEPQEQSPEDDAPTAALAEPASPAVPITPQVQHRDDEPAPVSPANAQLQALAEQISVRSATTDGKGRTQPARLADVGRKAAFTLRLDPERHLRLRLLSAVSNRSAQQLLVEALDEMIGTNEQVRALAAKVEKQ